MLLNTSFNCQEPIVETPEEYAKWMAEQQTFAEVIQ